MSRASLFSSDEQHRLLTVYREGLLQDTLSFWFPRSVDREHGGYFTALDRDGSLLETDKSVWFQGRTAWMLSTLYSTLEPRDEWLDHAKTGITFVQDHGFDEDGHMFYSLTQDGRPLRKRRYMFSEFFTMMGWAAYGRAAEDEEVKQNALRLFKRILTLQNSPHLFPAKVRADVRPMKGLGTLMALIVGAQELRKAVPDPLCDQVIDRCIAEIECDFMKPEFKCVLESVGPQGEFEDHFTGRLVNPGHAIEIAWFILDEALHRQHDERLITLGTTILDWSFTLGWDHEFGGMMLFCDAQGRSRTEPYRDMKFWWPHNETIIATLLAYHVTGDEKYARWHKMTHDWAYSHFPDPVHGEWYGWLRRDGSISTPLKGNIWKGFFHLPRMQWRCTLALQNMLNV